MKRTGIMKTEERKRKKGRSLGPTLRLEAR